MESVVRELVHQELKNFMSNNKCQSSTSKYNTKVVVKDFENAREKKMSPLDFNGLLNKIIKNPVKKIIILKNLYTYSVEVDTKK